MAPTDDNTKIALINNNIQYIQKDVSEIKSSIKELAGVYVTREALIEVAKQTEERFIVLEKAISRVENANTPAKTWVKHSLSGILGAILTFLLINYIQRL